MSLKRLLLDTVPNNMQQEPQFITLLGHIKEHNIESKEHLEKFISQQIDIVDNWMKGNKGNANVKTIRDKATQLDMLRKFDNLTSNFL
jgi:hypothetical protein